MKKYIYLFREIFEFIAQNKKWWLAPVFIFLLLLGAILVISSGSILSPFIYTLF